MSENKDDIKLINILKDIVSKSINPYVEKIREIGLKEYINNKLLGFNIDIDKVILLLLEKKLSAVKNIELGRGIGRVVVQYKNEKIIIKPTGSVGWLVNETYITNTQIINALNNVIEQLQQKCINDTSYLNDKIEKIFYSIADTGLYKPKTAEEKTIYDVVLLILVNYYNDNNKEKIPEWIKVALDNLEQVEIIHHLITLLIDQISLIAVNISENLYIDLKTTFDSKLIRLTMNKKTNRGQLSRVLKMLGVDIRSEIDKIVEDYMSPSFIKGMGQVVSDIVSSLLYEVPECNKNNEDGQVCFERDPYQITLTIGKDPITEKAIRWYTTSSITDGYVVLSETENFLNPIIIKAECKRVIKPKVRFSLGILASYKTELVSKYSAVLSNLKEDTVYWYKVGSKKEDNWSKTYSFKTDRLNENTEFIVLADSQGMIQDDYETFNEVFEAAKNKFDKSMFVCHMGDFVDDGNNENYWNWLLSDDIWKGQTVVPLSGNHEAKANLALVSKGIENSIVSHFNLQNLPDQDFKLGVYYSYIYKDITFIVLNTNDISEDNKLSDNQFNWAIDTALKANTKWKILLTHKSPYSNGPHHDDEDVQGIIPQINKIASKGKIDLVIAGHDHVYARTPALFNDIKSKQNVKNVKYNDISYKTILNPVGTVFVVPGTSGVKNYKQDNNVNFSSEVLAQPDCPVYSGIQIEGDNLYFTAYKYNLENKESEVLDCFAIEKNNKEKTEKNNFEDVIESINYISNDIVYLDKEQIEKSLKMYSALNKDKQKKVYNYDKLESSNRINLAFEKFESGKSVEVKNKEEFVKAILDNSVNTIITNADNIKFESIFKKDFSYIINRDLCITGNAKLLNITLKVVDNAVLVISGKVSIDNTREKGSLYKALNAIELYDKSVLVVKDYASLRTEYGIGRFGYCLYMYGRRTKAYFTSESEQWGSKGVVNAGCNTAEIYIKNSKFVSKKFVSKKKKVKNFKGKVNIIN